MHICKRGGGREGGREGGRAVIRELHFITRCPFLFLFLFYLSPLLLLLVVVMVFCCGRFYSLCSLGSPSLSYKHHMPTQTD